MNRNPPIIPFPVKAAALRAAVDSTAYFNASVPVTAKPAPALTPLELMYAYYDAA